MKNVLLIEHTEAYDSSNYVEVLKSAGAYIRTVNLPAGDSLPEDVLSFDAVISMDGHMSAEDYNAYPFLEEEVQFLVKAVEKDVPTLGISLGARLVAKACSAPVSRIEGRSTGWETVSLTSTGKRDILFYGLPRSMWLPLPEIEAFELPRGATLLATSKEIPSQAFRYRNSYGLQFTLNGSEGTGNCQNGENGADEQVLNGLDFEEDMYAMARAIFLNFMWLADMRAKAFDTEVGSEKWLIGQAEYNNWKIA